MKLILKLIFTLLITTLILSASQKEVDNIAQISAVSLYNIDKISLQSTVKAYINNNTNLKALIIVEELSGETYIKMYKKDDKTIYDKKLPKDIKNTTLHRSNAIFENEKVGEIFAYFKKAPS